MTRDDLEKMQVKSVEESLKAETSNGQSLALAAMLNNGGFAALQQVDADVLVGKQA